MVISSPESKVYYLIASHTTGWDPNPNKFFTASVGFFSFGPIGRFKVIPVSSLFQAHGPPKRI